MHITWLHAHYMNTLALHNIFWHGMITSYKQEIDLLYPISIPWHHYPAINGCSYYQYYDHYYYHYYHYDYHYYCCTLLLFKLAMENCPFIDDFPIKTLIYKGFSMAMLNNQRVIIYIIYILQYPIPTMQAPSMNRPNTKLGFHLGIMLH